MTIEWEAGVVPHFVINDRLRKARENTGMNIEAFAKHLGISRNTVSNYESATYTKRLQDSTLKLWAMATGVPYSWIKNGESPRPDTPDEGLVVRHQGLEPRTR